MPGQPPTGSAPGFDDHFERAGANIFRLETLQSYRNSGEDQALAAFQAGHPHLITPGKRAWVALIRDRTAAGCAMQRVHVVREPITDYLRFELTWGYQPNVEAGEDIRIVRLAPGDRWPVELPQGTDFWLFDFSVLYALRYGQDGTWLAAEDVTEPTAIEQACHWREAALRLAMPWRRYLDVHPDLARIVPLGKPRAS
ncbi:MAG: hypothetical protein JO272_09115 [Pseudonocardiales bacterium]|nr:hypothetical protein [Pseudonocardiales bacterium]